MYFDRFDIVEAYYTYYTDWHGGQSSWEYERLSQMHNYFTPSPLWRGYESLSENGREIYDNLVGKYQAVN